MRDVLEFTWFETREMDMIWQNVVRGLGPAVLLVLGACGGSQPPAQYGYGDMFEDDSVSRSSVSSSSSDYRGDMGGEATTDIDGIVDEEAAMGESDDMMEPQAEGSGGWSNRRSKQRSIESRREPPPPPAPPPQPAVMAAPEEQAAPEPEPTPTPPPVQAAVDGEPDTTTEAIDSSESGRPPSPTAEGERATPLMIYEATLGLAVHDVSERVDEVVRITYEIGGHVQSQTDTGVVVRVPAPRFRESLGLFEALGDVEQRLISAQDVSEAVRDIQIRLRNAMQMRDRLAQLLEAAQTVPESLAIEHELERLNETIALMEGALESLQDRIAFSTVTVNFRAIQDEHEIPRETFRLPFSWLDELGLQYLLQL